MSNERMMMLSPSLQAKVWGGQKLKQLKKLLDFDESQGGLGETWEISCHPSGPSFYLGRSLEGLIDGRKLPYLVKFIDTSAELSIQVHPDDDYAHRVEQSKGKTESWLILASDEGAGIYLGLKPGVTKQSLEQILSEQGDVSTCLNFYPVREGDFFFVPAGTIHAIGRGVTLAEIQQSSGITYRVWDWNRLGVDGKPRELHVRKSLDVINFDEQMNELAYFRFQNEKDSGQEVLRLIEHTDFVVDRYLKRDSVMELKGQHHHSILVLEGRVRVEVDKEVQYVDSYQAILIVDGNMMKVTMVKDNSRYLHIY